MSELRCRDYSRDDREPVVALSLRAWEPVFDSFLEVLGPRLFERFYPDWPTQQATAVGDALESNETWVCEVDGELAGFVNVTFDADELAGEIYMIAVDPTHQRRGVSAALTELAVAEMRKRGMTLATVSTGGDPGHAPARAAYEKAGFIPFPQVLYAKRLD